MERNRLLDRATAHGVWLLVLIVACVALITVLFLVGVRFAPGVGFTRAGAIVVEGLPASAVLYIDEQKRVDPKDGRASVSLLPGNHRIIIGTAEYQPWNELVTVIPGADTMLSPLFVPVTVESGIILPAAQADAWRLISRSLLPTTEAPLSLAGGCALISVSGSRVLATPTTTPSCEPPSYLCVDGSCATTVVLPGAESIRSLFAYPGRDDALIVALGPSLFVLELDPREPQFFAPLLRGTSAFRAALGEDGEIVVADGATLRSLFLEQSSFE